MARPTLTTALTTATPYAAKWTSAGIDITATTANVAPVVLPDLSGVMNVNFCIAGAGAGLTFTWKLLLVDVKILDASGNMSILRAIPMSTTAGARRSAGAGAAELYMHNDVILDIGGFGAANTDRFWMLSLESIGGDSAAYLIGYAPALMPRIR